jgi:hypothetical protein
MKTSYIAGYTYFIDIGMQRNLVSVTLVSGSDLESLYLLLKYALLTVSEFCSSSWSSMELQYTHMELGYHMWDTFISAQRAT